MSVGNKTCCPDQEAAEVRKNESGAVGQATSRMFRTSVSFFLSTYSTMSTSQSQEEVIA